MGPYFEGRGGYGAIMYKNFYGYLVFLSPFLA
jgi:hypothetical protein